MAEAGALSPCTGICQLDDQTGLCRGCFRTIEEIARWSTMGRAERVVVANALKARRHGLHPIARPGGAG
ncbi:MAG TPA: DUF1289 domain-containing protein [Aliidongia sp.]|nr:DUF1289 domain-containing protein [Aliidongia sp.]